MEIWKKNNLFELKRVYDFLGLEDINFVLSNVNVTCLSFFDNIRVLNATPNFTWYSNRIKIGFYIFNFSYFDLHNMSWNVIYEMPHHFVA